MIFLAMLLSIASSRIARDAPERLRPPVDREQRRFVTERAQRVGDRLHVRLLLPPPFLLRQLRLDVRAGILFVSLAAVEEDRDLHGLRWRRRLFPVRNVIAASYVGLETRLLPPALLARLSLGATARENRFLNTAN